MNRPRRVLTFTVVLSLLGLAGRAAGAPPPEAAPASATATSAATADSEVAPATRVHDEESLVRYALSHNLDLRAARWNQDIADAGVTTASALSNPVARAEWLHVQSPDDFGWGVGVQWSPPRPGVYGAGKNAARAEARAARGDFNEQVADLEAKVRAACATVEALDQEISLAEQSVQTRKALYEAVSARMQRGAANRIDVSLVAVSRARAEQGRDLLALTRASAMAELTALSGLPPRTSLTFAPRGAAGDAPSVRAAADDQSLVEHALRARPLVRADAARVEAAEELSSSERAARWPWMSVLARYRQHDQSTYPNDVTLGLEMTVPIMNQNGGPIAEAAARERAQRDRAAAHRLQVERDVRVLRAEVVRREEIAERFSESIVPVLREHAALVKDAMAGMALDLTAVLAAEEMVTRGEIEYVEAHLAQRRAQIALSRAVGAYGRSGARRAE